MSCDWGSQRAPPICHTHLCGLQKKPLILSINKMFHVLLAYGILSQTVKGIKGLYIDTMAQVVTKDGNTNFFPIIAGVQQGDTLAPYLFIIVLDYVMQTAVAKDDNFGITLHLQRRRNFLAVHLTDADFADDIFPAFKYNKWSPNTAKCSWRCCSISWTDAECRQNKINVL